MTNPSMDIGELKLCPFCGGGVSLEKADIGRRHDEWFGVVCRNTKNLGGTCCIEQTMACLT